MAASEKSIGTAKSGYAGPEKGPFACANCAHFSWPLHCDHSEGIEDAENGDPGLSLNRDGTAKVEPGGCCNEFRPK